jgi:branched-chain amino acid transport system ATP-binding protein
MLRLEGIDVFYGPVQALRGVSLEVLEGELVALLGGNGAGKTTTLMTCSGILRPRAGRLTFQNHDLAHASSDQIVDWGIVQCPEGRHIFGNLTVLENLQLGASHRRDRVGIEKDLQWVQILFPVIGERLRQKAAALSGGEQQMLAIARALLAKPRLLLLDEPSLGLSPVLTERIFRVIADLHSGGTTILLVEQNARKALQIADRAYLLETGRIALAGSSDDLRRDAQVESLYLGGVA